MVSVLYYKCIDVEDREVFNDKKWKGFISSLYKIYNLLLKIVIINELILEITVEVIIVGCVR